jgi:cytochrome c2
MSLIVKYKWKIIIVLLVLLGIYSYLIAVHKVFPFKQLYMGMEFLEYRYGWFNPEADRRGPLEAEVMETFLNRMLVKKVFISSEVRFGGGISNVDDKLFIVGSKGIVMAYNLDAHERYEAEITRVPLNYDELILSGHTTRNDFRQVWYRVSGIYAEKSDESDDTYILYASHNSYDSDTDCITHNISKSKLQFSGGRVNQLTEWETFFTAEPCIKPVPEHYLEAPYNGNISGGRITSYDENRLLVSVGDYDNNGLNNAPSFAPDPDVPYGKFILVDRNSGSWSVYSKGHRNPMGLYVDKEGVIWSAENGPRGGDELNIITEGEHYGWPEVSYGVWYDPGYPLDDGNNMGVHTGYKKPVFSWVPAIAPSNLVRIEGEKFQMWKGDLLVATMKNQSLHRLRLDENLNVMYDEQIRIGHRIRDMRIIKNDRIALITDDGYLIIIDDGGPVHTEMSAEAGERLAALNRFDYFRSDAGAPEEEAVAEMRTADFIYSSQCQACHSIEPRSGIGPHLYDLFNREIGGADNFPYSDVLRNDRREWTPELLRNFLTEPERYFPNNRMEKVNLTPAETDSIIIYLTNNLSL